MPILVIVNQLSLVSFFAVVRTNLSAASARKAGRTQQQCTWRWDKSVLAEYCEPSRVRLSCVPHFNSVSCGEHCDNPPHCSLIDSLYYNIISTLHDAAVDSVVRLPLKPF